GITEPLAWPTCCKTEESICRQVWATNRPDAARSSSAKCRRNDAPAGGYACTVCGYGPHLQLQKGGSVRYLNFVVLAFALVFSGSATAEDGARAEAERMLDVLDMGNVLDAAIDTA